MREFFSGMAEKPYRATQVMKWVYHQGITDFEKMTDISKGLRENLAEQTAFQLPEIVSEQVSNDGTRKWLLRVDKKNCIETVFIPEKDRGTLCISSQVGCPLDCSFCSTGKQGFNRNLGVSEIIGQLWLANRELGSFQTPDRIITNVVMMGMGEPLLGRDQFFDMIRYARSKHIWVRSTNNGSLLHFKDNYKNVVDDCRDRSPHKRKTKRETETTNQQKSNFVFDAKGVE